MWETYVEITSVPLNGEFLLEDSQRWWMVSFFFAISLYFQKPYRIGS